MKRATHSDIGQIGERATAALYKKQGFELVCMNYRKPFGEIDVIVRDSNILIFIEVKSVSCRTFEDGYGGYNPGERIHAKKQGRLRKTITAFLSECDFHVAEWRFDIALALVNTSERKVRIERIENVIL